MGYSKMHQKWEAGEDTGPGGADVFIHAPLPTIADTGRILGLLPIFEQRTRCMLWCLSDRLLLTSYLIEWD